MIGLIQRVRSAQVDVDQQTIGKIDQGILLLLGIQREDTTQQADKLLHKVINYRIFEDSVGKMNQSLQDIGGELLIVSQFTLPADTRKGLRPSFTPAAPPVLGLELYNYFIEKADIAIEPTVQTGEFGADMQVSLVNDGPVTFWLEV